MLTDEKPTVARVEDLLAQLLDYLDHNRQPIDQSEKLNYRPEVVLEVCLGGLRYTLTRMPSPVAVQEQINLSPREQEIIRLICAGLPNKAISDVLEISPWTVGTYLKRIFAKLNVGSRAEMVAKVLQDGLLNGHHLNGVVEP